MSYTTFDMKNVKVEPGTKAGTYIAMVDVTNTGDRAGKTVVELYVRPPAAEAVDRPAQELKGFDRVELQPGQSRSVSIPLNSRSFSHWDADLHDWKVEPGDYEIAVGRSSRDICATTVVHAVK